MDLDIWIVSIALLFAVLGGVISVAPPKRPFTKYSVVALFIALGIASYFLSSAQKSHDEAAKNTALANEQKNQTTIQKKLDLEIAGNIRLRTTLLDMRAIIKTGAQKQDIASILLRLSDLSQTNAQLYYAAMTVASWLDTTAGIYQQDMRSLEEDRHNRWVVAKVSGDSKKVDRVDREYDSRQKSMMQLHQRELKTHLSEAKRIQAQLIERFPGPPPRLDPDALSLLNAGCPDTIAANDALAAYLKELARPLSPN